MHPAEWVPQCFPLRPKARQCRNVRDVTALFRGFEQHNVAVTPFAAPAVEPAGFHGPWRLCASFLYLPQQTCITTLVQKPREAPSEEA